MIRGKIYLITTLASGIINVSKSMYIKKKMEYNNDEVLRKFNKLSTKAKIMSNIKNIFITLCPVVNIIHSIKNLRTSNDSLYSKWKKNTLENDETNELYAPKNKDMLKIKAFVLLYAEFIFNPLHKILPLYIYF